MASRDDLKRLIDALPEGETDHALVLLGALVKAGAHPQNAVEKQEREQWLETGLETTRQRLTAEEADLPAHEVATWLAQLKSASTPVRWDDVRGEFVEVSG